MIIHLKEVISKDELQSMRTILESPGTPWIEGKKTAGTQAQLVKNNEQLQSGSEQAKRLRKIVLDALKRNPIFLQLLCLKKSSIQCSIDIALRHPHMAHISMGQSCIPMMIVFGLGEIFRVLCFCLILTSMMAVNLLFMTFLV
nr:hypothetical protein [Hydrogenophilus thiooxidans]